MQCEVLAMGLTKLGNYIQQTDIRNYDLKFGEEDVKGISTTKQFIDTKADLLGVSLKSYKVIGQNEFVYVADTSRRGDKIGLAYCENKPCIVSSIYTSFRIKEESKLLPRFLMMFFNRSEFDRYARFNSWGSARETFTWEDMCDIELDLPPIEIQRKYVAIYEGLLANLHSFESKLEELKLVCDGYIEDLRKKYPSKTIGKYLKLTTKKNVDDEYQNIIGISNTQKLVPSDSRTNGVDTSRYLILKPGDFAYSPIHINDGSIALNMTDNTYVISPIYATFRTDEDYLHNEYLMLWFARNEFARYCWFHAFGTARDTFEWGQMQKVEIPIPPLEIQNSIVEVFNVYNERKEYVNRLKNIIKDICPLLVRGAIKEASEVK